MSALRFAPCQLRASHWLAGLLLLAVGSAAAQTEIFKCANADGSIEYRDSPCTGSADKLLWQRAEAPYVPAVIPPETASAAGSEPPSAERKLPDWLRPPDAARRQQLLQALADMRHRLPPIWQLALAMYALMSVISFCTYGLDKRAARAGRRRVRERTLHWQEFLGGWPGALLAQQVFRHKTSKGDYQFDFWLIVVLHGLLWFDYLLGFPLLGAIGDLLSRAGA